MSRPPKRALSNPSTPSRSGTAPVLLGFDAPMLPLIRSASQISINTPANVSPESDGEDADLWEGGPDDELLVAAVEQTRAQHPHLYPTAPQIHEILECEEHQERLESLREACKKQRADFTVQWTAIDAQLTKEQDENDALLLNADAQMAELRAAIDRIRQDRKTLGDRRVVFMQETEERKERMAAEDARVAGMQATFNQQRREMYRRHEEERNVLFPVALNFTHPLRAPTPSTPSTPSRAGNGPPSRVPGPLATYLNLVKVRKPTCSLVTDGRVMGVHESWTESILLAGCNSSDNHQDWDNVEDARAHWNSLWSSGSVAVQWMHSCSSDQLWYIIFSDKSPGVYYGRHRALRHLGSAETPVVFATYEKEDAEEFYYLHRDVYM